MAELFATTSLTFSEAGASGHRSRAAGRVPLLAEGSLGFQAMFVGQDMYSGESFVYDPWVLYQRGIISAPNPVLAGIVGSGRSSLAKSLYTRSVPFGRRMYVPGDPKGEHTAVGRRWVGKRSSSGMASNPLNPLDESCRTRGLSDAGVEVAGREERTSVHPPQHLTDAAAGANAFLNGQESLTHEAPTKTRPD